MATTVQQILDAALDRNLFNDTAIVDLVRTVAWLDRLVKRIYGLASRPVPTGSQEKDDYFADRTTLTLGGSPTVLPVAVQSAASMPPRFLTASGERVSLASQLELADGTAELPPAVIFEKRRISATGRTGDVTTGDVLTVIFTPVPATLSDVAHYIGAATATDATTSLWPDHPGNEALIAELARYLALKDGGTDPAELQKLEGEVTGELTDLLNFLRGRP